jgi:transposase
LAVLAANGQHRQDFSAPFRFSTPLLFLLNTPSPLLSGDMMSTSLPTDLHLESLEVGATPLVRHFLQRLRLPEIFERHLPALPGRQPDLPHGRILALLVTNMLIARQPLYAIPGWVAKRVPEYLDLQPEQVALLNDDRFGRALDHFDRADRASLLTTLVTHAVREFAIDMTEFHQDTTTVTFSGDYREASTDDPVHITFGHNKDHRPDLKQLLFSITISDDGAVPVHFKLDDGNTTDDAVHIETWDFLRHIIGHSDFLYVADSKLCTRENMNHIRDHQGRFLTVMPRTRGEVDWFLDYQFTHSIDWREVRRQPHPRQLNGPEVVYHAVEAPRRCSEGYRVLWYRSSQKQIQDQQTRQRRLERAHARLDARQAGKRRDRNHGETLALAERIRAEEKLEDLLDIAIDSEVEEEYRQEGPGRPGPDTIYQRIEHFRYRARFVEKAEGIRRAASADGLFPLMTNDESLSLTEALDKYKYQPFVEKRHEQLKNVFHVAPVRLKSVKRVSSLLWLYYAVELIQALLEREVRRQMADEKLGQLALYPEDRDSDAPTTALVLAILEGHRRHRLLDASQQELRRFHDPLPPVAREVLQLLQVDATPYG